MAEEIYTEEMRNEIVQALQEWVNTSDDSTSKLLFGGRKGGLAPQDILDEIRNRTPTGEKLLAAIKSGTSDMTFPEVLEALRKD